jgi:hypothetical protein
MGPNGSVLVGERIVRGIFERQRSDAPTTPHIELQNSRYDASCAFGAHDTAPQQVPGIGRDGVYLLLVAIEGVCIKPEPLTPEKLFESLP